MAVRDTFVTVADGDQLNDGYFNGIVNYATIPSLLNLVRMLQDRSVSFSAAQEDAWGEAYVDADGRLNSVDTGSTTATFDTDKYASTSFPSGTEPYVIIEATSISGTWTVNDCVIAAIDTGKWVLYCTTGTDEVRRAQIYKTLFYGTTGSDPRASATYITGITALKTSVTRDVGTRAYYVYAGHANNYTQQYDGSFDSTTGNEDVSSWSYLADSNGVLSDETGTDQTADEVDNPSTCRLYGRASQNSGTIYWSIDSTNKNAASKGNYGFYGRAFILTTSTITWTWNGSGGSYGNTDFTTTNSIPVMTAATENPSDFLSLVVHDIPSGTFSDTISSAILSPLIDDWETGANIQYKLTNSGAEDSGWLDINEISSFTAFTAEPETLIVKLIPKDTSPTPEYPSIKGVALKAE